MPFAAIGAALGISAGAAAIGTTALVGGIAGDLISSSAADSAAKTQANATTAASQEELQAQQLADQTQLQAQQDADNTQLTMFGQTTANEQPYLTAGGNALTALLNGTGAGPGGTGTGALNAPYSQPFNAPAYNPQFTESPGYKFQLDQGIGADLNAASRTGGILSGNTLKALNTFGTGLANQDYYNYLNNYNTQYWNQYNAYNQQYWNQANAYTSNQNQTFQQLETLAGNGQNAAANLGSAGTNVANNIANGQINTGTNIASGNIATAGQVGNNIIGGANAISAGQVASGNAFGNTLNNVGSNFLLANLFQGRAPGAASGGGGGSFFNNEPVSV